MESFSEELVTKRAAKYAIGECLNKLGFYKGHPIKLFPVIEEAIDKMKPMHKKGYWKPVRAEDLSEHVCSCCGHEAYISWYCEEILSNYCPECGAYMGENE